MMAEERERLLLVGWEVGDWDFLHPLIDQGETPNLARIVNQGASGGLSCPPPFGSSSQWTTLATGKRAWQHQICLPYQGETGKGRMVGAGCRAARPLWDVLADQGRRALAIGWPTTHGGRGCATLVSYHYHIPTAPPGRAWPAAPAGTYSCESVAAQLDPLRVSPEQVTPDVLDSFAPDWRTIDQDRDPSLAQLRIVLAADFSYQAAAAHLLQAESWSFAAVRFPGLAQFCRLFARQHLLADDPTAKTNPVYRDTLPAMFRAADAMLGRLIEIAGPGTAVVLAAPCGVNPRPGPEPDAWKRPVGVFAAAGPGFAEDALLHGMNSLDVAPTVLDWFGLPVGQDMEGRVRVDCLTAPSKVARVATWETEDSSAAAIPQRESLSQTDRWGYDWNTVESLLDAGRYVDALPLLESLFQAVPENPLFSQTLFQTQLSQGMIDQAEQTLEVLVDSLPPSAAPLPRAELALARGDKPLVRQCLDELLKNPPRSSEVWRRIGLLLHAMREWNKLEGVARAVLNQNEQDEIAWLGLAEAKLRKRDFPTAEAAAKRAIGLRFFLPDAHLVLARALAGQGKHLAAVQAGQRLIEIDPGNTVAQKYVDLLIGQAT